jgi:WD40 repeat protein
MSDSLTNNTIEDQSKDVLVIFSTNVLSYKSKIPESSIAVPSSLNRVGLSQVVSHLLGINESNTSGKEGETDGGVSTITSNFEFTVTLQQFEWLKKSTIRSGKSSNLEEKSVLSSQGETLDLVSRPLLRTSLKRYARSIGLTTEDTLHLEFAPAVEAPKPARGGPHGLPVRDWVSSIVCGGAFAIAGLTDGTLSFALDEDLLVSTSSSAFSSSSTSTVFAAVNIHGGADEANSIVHRGGISGVDIFERGRGSGSNGAMIATSGRDCLVRLWTVDEANSRISQTQSSKGSSKAQKAALTLNAAGELSGSEDACGGVAFDPSGSFVACGDARGALMLWNCDESVTQNANPDTESSSVDVVNRSGKSSSASTSRVVHSGLKRQRSSDSKTLSSSTTSPRSPILRIASAHTGRVSGVCWLSASQLASCSWDHTVNVWDVEDIGETSSSSNSNKATLSPITSLRCGKVVTSITASPLGGTLATGHADNAVRIWDPRGRGGSAGQQGGAQEAIGLRASLNGAMSWVADVSFHPSSGHHVAASTHAGTCLLWDVRAPQSPLFEIARHSDKALAVAWTHSGTGILSGGADSTIRVSSVSINTSRV